MSFIKILNSNGPNIEGARGGERRREGERGRSIQGDNIEIVIQ